MNIKTCPLWQWILVLIGLFVLGTIGYGLWSLGSELLHSPLMDVVLALVLLAAYTLLEALIEKEKAPDVLNKRAVPDLLLGLAIGLVFFVLIVGIMLLAGCGSIEKLGFDAKAQLSAFCMFFGVAVGEEVLFRGVVYKWIDKRWGMTVALIVSALIFGAIHIGNDNATWWSALAIAIEAGLLLGAAYKYFGTLWLPIGIHWAWNYTQGNIFGFAVSGNDAGNTLFKMHPQGADILTGGAFGAEASIISILLGAALAALFVFLHIRKSRRQGCHS